MKNVLSWRIVVVAVMVLILATACQKVERKALTLAGKAPAGAPTLALNWSDAPTTWSLKGGEQTFQVTLTNRGANPVWATIKPFENACFACKGFGPWTPDWDAAGRIPADGAPHPVLVPFTPRAACPATEYHFFAETTNAPSQAPAPEFSTAQDDHAGSKTFRVQIVE